MILLLDTQALVWWREGNRKLGRKARAAIERDATAIRISAVTALEVAIKSSLGRLRLQEPVDRWMTKAFESSRFQPLDVTMEHAIRASTLPAHHPDPFDRLLIAQAQIEELRIVTADTAFDDYDVKLLDARS